MSSSPFNKLHSSFSGKQPQDMEAGPVKEEADAEDDVVSDPFDIAQTKHVPLESLKRWRVF